MPIGPSITSTDWTWASKNHDRLEMMVKELFDGVLDHGRNCYIIHLEYVAKHQQNTYDSLLAFWHDAMEVKEVKKTVTVEWLRHMGFPECFITRLLLLTRKDGQSYEDYIDGLLCDVSVCRVKKWDLMHNLQLGRLRKLEQVDLERAERYFKALKKVDRMTL